MKIETKFKPGDKVFIVYFDNDLNRWEPERAKREIALIEIFKSRSISYRFRPVRNIRNKNHLARDGLSESEDSVFSTKKEARTECDKRKAEWEKENG